MSDLQTVDCDVLVIGGGITGCFIALRLDPKGLKAKNNIDPARIHSRIAPSAHVLATETLL